jgi:hypothetical protein
MLMAFAFKLTLLFGFIIKFEQRILQVTCSLHCRSAFLNPNYSATRFSQDLKLLDTGHSLFKPIFTLLLYPHLKKIFRDCLRSYNKIKYVFLANFFQLRNEKCSLTFLCYFLATRFKSSMSRYWVATRRLRNPAVDEKK